MSKTTATPQLPSGQLQNFQQAIHAFQQGALNQAEAICKAILAAQPGSFDALHMLGVLHYQEGRYSDALVCLEAAFKQQPHHLPILSGLGLVHGRLRQYEEALTYHDHLLALEPDHAETLNNRGNTLMELQRPGEALTAYDRALGLRPQLADAHNNRGKALMLLTRLNEALESFDQAVTLRPDYADAFNNRGTLLLVLKRPGDALASFDKALSLSPHQADLLNNRSTALKDLGRLNEALASAEKALMLEPEHAGFHNNRGNVLKDLRRPAEALACYDEAIAITPDFADAYNNKGLVLNDLGRVDAAKEAIEKAISLAPRVPRFYNHLSECKRLTADDPHFRAMRELAEDMSSFSTDEQAQLHFGMGKAYADIGDPEHAMQHWLDGNALNRRLINYDAPADIDLLARTQVAFTAELLSNKSGGGDPCPVPVFILGMPRSGTTLVEQILASHPKVFGAGEIDDFGQAATRLSGSQMASYSPEYLSRLSDTQLRRFGASYVDHIRALAPSAERITDKTPENFRFVGLIHMVLPNARIIHTRRDPVDTCLSCLSKSFVGNSVPYAFDLSELGRFYATYDSLMAHWHKVLPPGVMLDLQYEDVVADLEGQARRILAHCGLEWDPRCLDFHRTERPVHTASRTQVRQPIFKSSVGRWRSYEPFLGPLLTALGHDDKGTQR